MKACAPDTGKRMVMSPNTGKAIPMRKMLIALPLMLAAPTMAQDVTFDIEAYCIRVADAVGGSYQIEEACRKQEAAARGAMRSTEQRIAAYCARVAEAVGGSYQIYNTCVDQEEAARGRIGQ